MKICLAHNEYGKFSGEEAAVARQIELLKANGHEVVTFKRTSAGLERRLFGMVRAFFSGIYNPFSRREFGRFLDEHKPDIVHVHNVFPLISPSILPECRQHGIPVVMTLHNFRLICPNALLSRNGNVCHECLGGHEWKGVANNCEQNFFKSLGYALRTAVARKKRYFLDNVDVFICLTEFQRAIFAREGFPQDHLVVIPNFINAPSLDAQTSVYSLQSTANSPYVLYAGRVSPEKDVDALVEAARKLPDVVFKIAGSHWRMPELAANAPRNMEFLGELPAEKLTGLYAGARMVVFATRCYEGFPAVLLEAMVHARPVICARTGGLPEIVEDSVNGLLYEPSNAGDLAGKIRTLWQDDSRCSEMGRKGREKALKQYSAQTHFDLLQDVYSGVILKAKHGATAGRACLGKFHVDGLTMKEALSRLDSYVKDGRTHSVFFCEGSILSNIARDAAFVSALESADMVLPDGVGTMLLGRIHGYRFPERIQGPRFMLEVFRESQSNGYRHFFYGSTPEVLKQLAENLQKKFSGCRIAGSYSPPFRDLTGEEAAQVAGIIEKSGADILWVALGSPRQEKWVAMQAGKIKVPVLLAVGAAFDFHAGHRPWAPEWIRAVGMEWVFRMLTGGGRTFARNLFRVLPGVSWLLMRAFFKARTNPAGSCHDQGS